MKNIELTRASDGKSVYISTGVVKMISDFGGRSKVLVKKGFKPHAKEIVVDEDLDAIALLDADMIKLTDDKGYEFLVHKTAIVLVQQHTTGFSKVTFGFDIAKTAVVAGELLDIQALVDTLLLDQDREGIDYLINVSSIMEFADDVNSKSVISYGLGGAILELYSNNSASNVKAAIDLL